MRARHSAVLMACVVLSTVHLRAGQVQAGRPTEKPSSQRPYAQSRTPDGQPDIRGFWHVVPFGTISIETQTTGTNFGDPFAQASVFDASRGPVSRIVDPPDGKIPYQPWAAAKAKDIQDHFNDPTPYQLDPQSRCWLQGVPRGMYQSESHFIQTPGQIVILHDFSHSYRVIPLDDRPRLPENMKLFMGDARGRWDGNTLVIETTNLNKLTWFAAVGSFHSDALHVTERLTRVDDDTMDYLAVIDDPKMHTRPWTMRFVMKRNTTPNWEQWEVACREGNRSLELQLSHPAKEN